MKLISLLLCFTCAAAFAQLATKKALTLDAAKKIAAAAEAEMSAERKNPFFMYHVMNDNLEQAIDEVVQIIKDELSKLQN